MSQTRLRTTRMWVSLLFALGLFSGMGLYASPAAQAQATHSVKAAPVQLQVTGMTATISNSFYTIMFNSNGTGYSLVIGGKELIGPAKGFYSSINGGTGFTPTALEVVTNTPEMADIAYISTWGELHYVVRRDVSGLYSYFVATGIGTVGEYRTLYRVDRSIFPMAYNGEHSGPFPTLSQIAQSKVLQDSTYNFPMDRSTPNTMDYLYGARHVHGVYGSGYGVWMIPPSHEYYNGGPMKQELMVHVERQAAMALCSTCSRPATLARPRSLFPVARSMAPGWSISIMEASPMLETG